MLLNNGCCEKKKKKSEELKKNRKAKSFGPQYIFNKQSVCVCADNCIGNISDHLFYHQNIYIFFKSPQKAKEITNALSGLKLAGLQNQCYVILVLACLLAPGAPGS